MWMLPLLLLLNQSKVASRRLHVACWRLLAANYATSPRVDKQTEREREREGDSTASSVSPPPFPISMFKYLSSPKWQKSQIRAFIAGWILRSVLHSLSLSFRLFARWVHQLWQLSCTCHCCHCNILWPQQNYHHIIIDRQRFANYNVSLTQQDVDLSVRPSLCRLVYLPSISLLLSPRCGYASWQYVLHLVCTAFAAAEFYANLCSSSSASETCCVGVGKEDA